MGQRGYSFIARLCHLAIDRAPLWRAPFLLLIETPQTIGRSLRFGHIIWSGRVGSGRGLEGVVNGGGAGAGGGKGQGQEMGGVAGNEIEVFMGPWFVT